MAKRAKQTVETMVYDSEGNASVAVQEAGDEIVGMTDAEIAANRAKVLGTDKPTESKAQRFVRLGQRRVPKAVKAIRAIGNLANRAQYTYTEEQWRKIMGALTSEVEALYRAFNGAKKKEDTFRL